MNFIKNTFLAYAVYMACRIIFILENWGTYHEIFSSNSLVLMLQGALTFDTSAIVYTNLPYIILALLPPIIWSKKILKNKYWKMACKWLFVVVNSLAVVLNLSDAVYVQFTNQRTTAGVFREFSNDNNLSTILGHEYLNHWYLVLAGLVLIALMWGLYTHPTSSLITRSKWTDKGLRLGGLILLIPLCIGGMRGGLTTSVRPITISNANQYVNRPIEAVAILNTPFSIIRTLGKNCYPTKQYFTDEELDRIYNPVHQPAIQEYEVDRTDSTYESATCKSPNIVILIVESLGREYIGAYNTPFPHGEMNGEIDSYRGYTPFIDSLYQHCLSFDFTFANGHKSIDAMPSVLSSIPMLYEHFFTSPKSLNNVGGLVHELSKDGYSSAFFHGAANGSMGFEAFARTIGFQRYYGRTEFDQDKRFGGEKDFDGTWAIWDAPFMQFMAEHTTTDLKEPFVETIFTASSHHPFRVPAEFDKMLRNETPDGYEKDPNPMHRCIRYFDSALQQYFDTASRQPWFKNTIFVIVGDHTNQKTYKEYTTSLGLYEAALLFYDPSGRYIQPGRSHAIASQIDIMPTLLGVIGYERPYIAFGQDLLHTPADQTWSIMDMNGLYQFVQGDYVLHFDGERPLSLYNIRNDWMMQHDLLSSQPQVAEVMLRQIAAILQSYAERMNNNKLIVDEE